MFVVSVLRLESVCARLFARLDIECQRLSVHGIEVRDVAARQNLFGQLVVRTVPAALHHESDVDDQRIQRVKETVRTLASSQTESE